MSLSNSPPFDLELLQAATFVQQVDSREEADSTNSLALELSARRDVTTPLLVLATRQTSGRGRGANRWWAARGSLTFSLVLDAQAQRLAARDWPKISLTTGVAICRVLRQFAPGVEIGLKWPNDVFLKSRKVSGILVEASAGVPAMVVIGVGINVNNSLANAPEALRTTAASLVDVNGREVDSNELLVRLLREIEARLADLAGGGCELAESWREFCMLEGRTVQVDWASRSVTGVCRGIDEEGALLLETDGGMARCLAGTVARVD